jgi:prepilin-type N-terminal cleavage/methylation domain-containing protein
MMLIRMRKCLRNQKGFTMLELLAVMAIIGILAAIAVPVYSTATTKANTAKIAADLMAIDTACGLAVANGQTPQWGGTVTAPAVDISGTAYFATKPVPPTSGNAFFNGTSTAITATTYIVAQVGTTGTYRGYITQTTNYSSDMMHQ